MTYNIIRSNFGSSRLKSCCVLVSTVLRRMARELAYDGRRHRTRAERRLSQRNAAYPLENALKEALANEALWHERYADAA